uniref:Chromodomain-helicase-DNA-binding protein 1-like n=1 Tax=Paramormyrops kingsleyae TaxID=1676925 RepID=A0A3B3QJ20_9TELE|nr:chromodomain-helicase-DNA-binding protein 1-like [Paramormyrops kingsleyae]
MPNFLQDIQRNIPEKKVSDLAENHLKKWGLTGIHLRAYQLDGVRWLTQCLSSQSGCILGDEMGLGKTCQTIALLLYMKGSLGHKGPFLVLSPLSVMENWREEMERFSPGLVVVSYTGDKEARAELRRELIQGRSFHVLLTSYELCLKDSSFLERWQWKVLVVDEAHRLKNQNSLLHRTLTQFSIGFKALLTGTPIQNNLAEVYSLLSFIQPSIFPESNTDDFISSYARVEADPKLASELHRILQPFLLRRVKAEVATELPKKTELVVYHGMSALQKRYYRAILTRDLDAFEDEQGNKTRLQNILMHLRKCVSHPYLFDGVEPEPFEMGEHLVEASGKLHLLDRMLEFLHQGGHRVLLFSQFTRLLDILQDYMEYRDYSYERLDGSIRGEERNLAIKNFSNKDVFVFLLSTKAGGVGMNLTAADTVIFMDSDFNPQNDLQAAARAHRIGQTRPVKVIRLLARNTVEEIVYTRAVSKLRLTDTVIEEGRFSLLSPAQSADAGLQLSEILKFGVDKLLASEESSVQNVDLGLILGRTEDGQWVDDEEPMHTLEEEEGSASENQVPDHMYVYEGRDYSRDPSSEDQKSFERLLDERLAAGEKEGRVLRCKPGVSLSGPLMTASRRKRPLSEAELELRRQKRQEVAAKKAKLQEDRKRQREEQQRRRKMEWWDSCGYRTLCLPSDDSEEDQDEEEDVTSIFSVDSDRTDIHYVLGDVTHPHTAQQDAIIVHCVDDSGHWGRGGLFTALEVRSDQPRKQYELAGEMKDLELGHVLLFPIDDKESRMDGQDQLALIIAQQRDRSNNLSGIRLSALEDGLKKIYKVAKRKNASVHLPRIGHSTKGFNWYGTERLIRKHLASRGVPTYIYYYSRVSKQVPSTSHVPTSPATLPSPDSPHGADTAKHDQGPSPPALADFMHGIHVFFYNIAASYRKSLVRHLIAYDGDEHQMMSSGITHIVAEVETPVHKQELLDFLDQHPQALPVQMTWLETCFSEQKRVSETHFLLELH